MTWFCQQNPLFFSLQFLLPELFKTAHHSAISPNLSIMVCTVCASMFSSTSKAGQHHQTALDMQSAAELQKCPICMEMLGQMRRQGSPLIDPAHKRPFLNYSFNYLEDEGLWNLQIRGSWSSHSLSQYKLASYHFLKLVLSEGKKEGDEKSNSSFTNQFILRNFKLVSVTNVNRIVNDDLDNQQPNTTSHLNAISDRFNTSMVPPDTGDPRLAMIGLWWLENCLGNHKTCNESREDGWYPARLLDLTGHEPRLLISEIEKPDGPYATLSHCWGPDPKFLQLTADNLESFCSKVSFTSLPKTFQEAIKTTKWLNLKYLWIDSLCILQSGKGSLEDWRKHAVAMRAVYSNCVLNIAASRARCAEDGCFTARDPLLVQPCEVQWHEFRDEGMRRFQVIDTNFCFERLSQTPLAERAWVLQERLLAPRILHFARQQLFWECSELPVACETFPFGFPCKMPEFGLPPFNALASSRWLSTSGDTGSDMWRRILRDYTKRNLTRPFDDKFVALSGIVERITRMPGVHEDDYIAGLYRKDLPFALLWGHNPAASTATSRAEKYRAPTWSWASVDGPLAFDFTEQPAIHTCLVTINDITVDLVDERNRAGQLRSAELKLHGVLLAVTWEKTSYLRLGKGQGQVNIEIEIGEGKRIKGQGFMDDLREVFQGEQGTTAVLPVRNNIPETGNIVEHVTGLILRATLNGIRAQYVRLGTFWLSENAREFLETVERRPMDQVIIV
jgi:hypothetical protein